MAGKVVMNKTRLTVLKCVLFMLLNVLGLDLESIEQILDACYFGQIFSLSATTGSAVLYRTCYSKSGHFRFTI